MSVRVPFAPAAPLRRRIGDGPNELLGHGRRVPVPGGQRTWKGTGTWLFKLTTRSPLCIRTLYEDLAANNRPAFIPGSSLRGMFRNMVQVIGAGCALDFGGTPPSGFEPCTASLGFCLACRLFGTVYRDPTTQEDTAWMGKVRVRDTSTVQVNWERHSMFGPREARAPDADQWILFECGTTQPAAGNQLRCVPTNTDFEFAVDFANLDAEEAAVLQFAITLRHGADTFYHKLGFGKAMGLGKVKIDFVNQNERVNETPMNTYASYTTIWQVLQNNRAYRIRQ